VSTPSFFFLGAKVGDGDDVDMTLALFSARRLRAAAMRFITLSNSIVSNRGRLKNSGFSDVARTRRAPAPAGSMAAAFI
jgi:hypothetical protein